jgi:hypothetical protein
MVSFGLRPAIIVVLVGLIPSGFLIWRNLHEKGWFKLRKLAA